MYGSMVDLKSMQRAGTAAARSASGGPPIWFSLGMAVVFMCSGCVDLAKPWERAGRLDAGGTGGLGGNGQTATGSGGQTVTTFPSGLDGGDIVDGGESDQAVLGGSGDTAMPGAGGNIEVGSGGADGRSTSGTGEAWDAGSGGVDSATPDDGLVVQTGGTGGDAIDGAGRSPNDLQVDSPADVPTGDARGTGTADSGKADSGTADSGTADTGTADSRTGDARSGETDGTTDASVGIDGRLSAGLVAYYPCESATNAVLPDSSGHKNDGTLASGAGAATGTACSFAGGEVGNGLFLDSANKGYLSVPSGILASAVEMTVAQWVYLKSNPSWQRIFDFGQDQNVDMVFVSNNNSTGRPRFAISLTGPSGAQVIDGPSAFPTGSWTHLAIVIGPSGGILYINGQQVGANSSLTLRPVDLGSTPNNFFGRSQYASDPYLDGNLDEIRIYDRALTPAEISALANGS
jgi:hypothetical protein